IVRALDALPEIRVMLFEPSGTPSPEGLEKSSPPQRMTLSTAILVSLIERYLAGLMDPFVTLLEVHKLLYLCQEAGESLQLDYVKGPYGPYAQNLRHVLHRLEGHFVSGYADGGDDPSKQLELVPGASDFAMAVLATQPESSL